MAHGLKRSLAAIGLCAAIGACGGGDAAPQANAARPDSSSGEVAQYALMKNNIGWLTDSNVVALASQVNASAQQIAQLEAQTWASEPRHALALDIIRDHQRMQFAIDSLTSLKRIPSQMPAVAPSMKTPYDSLLATQVGLPMAEREAQLVDRLLQVHAQSIIDFAAVAGNATDPDLRALLANRGVLMEQTHISRMTMFKTALAKADSAKQDSAKTTRKPPRQR